MFGEKSTKIHKKEKRKAPNGAKVTDFFVFFAPFSGKIAFLNKRVDKSKKKEYNRCIIKINPLYVVIT